MFGGGTCLGVRGRTAKAAEIPLFSVLCGFALVEDPLDRSSHEYERRLDEHGLPAAVAAVHVSRIRTPLDLVSRCGLVSVWMLCTNSG